MKTGAATARSSVQIEQRINIGLTFIKKGYIAQPFWPELKTAISIQKTSGFNRAKAEAKRRQALTAELEKRNMTMADYDTLIARTKRPFYRLGQPEREDGEIVIPGDNFLSFIANIAHRAPRAVAKIDPASCRVAVEIDEPLRTGKFKEDGIYIRFVRNEESNEPMLAESPYIKDFQATAMITVNTEMIAVDDLLRMIEHGARWIGLGAARPMGYGRFKVSKWELLGEIEVPEAA